MSQELGSKQQNDRAHQDFDLDFRLLFEASPDVLLVLLPDAPRFTMVAATGARLRATHMTREQVVGKPLFEVFSDDPADRDATGVRNLRESLERVLATGEPDTMPVQRYAIRTPDGEFVERHWSPVNIPVLSAGGEVRYILHRVEDVTELVAAELTGEDLRDRASQMEREVVKRSQELGESNRKLRTANAQLKDLDAAKTQFFHDVSHELRTPLTLLLGPLEELLEAARRDPGLERHRSNLDTMRRSALRLRRLVNASLDFARLEAGRHVAAFSRTDLARLTTDLASMFRSAAKRAGLRMAIDCPPLPEEVYVDRSMWEKLVMNLLSNAIKFTFEGGITIELREAGGRAILEVRDTGVGIPKDELPHVFGRFYRARNMRARATEGTGIGLALVDRVARIHGGTVSLDSAEGRGTRVTVAIPLGSSHLPTEQVREVALTKDPEGSTSDFLEEVQAWLPGSDEESGESPSLPADDALPRPRILVADDNGDMRTYLRHVLAGPFQVETVSDGESALHRALATHPNLIVSDIMMPRMDGIGLVRELRARPETRSIPIILLTARAGDENAVEGLEVGADDYVSKPFSRRELVARVRTQLRLSEHRRSRTAVAALEEVLTRLRPVRTGALRALRTAREESDLGVAEDAERYLERIGELTDWVEDRLELERLQAGELRVEMIPYGLSALLQEALEAVRPSAARAGVTLDARGIPQSAVACDPERCGKALRLVLRRAASLAERGGHVRVSSPHPDVLDVTFETRVESAAIIHQDQALELARALIERQEGAVRVHVTDSTVTVSLRFGAVRVSERPPSGDAQVPDESALQVCTILLVEDDPDIRESLVEALTLLGGFEVVTAIHGLDAIEKLKRTEILPDVILTDLMMPVMNGKELRRALGSSPAWQDIPIIVLSARAEVESYELDVEGVLRKPVPLDRLQQVLMKACRKRQLNLLGSRS